MRSVYSATPNYRVQTLAVTSLMNVVEFLLPTSCILCEQRQNKPICSGCVQELKTFQTPRCIICANPFHGWVCRACQQTPPSFHSSICIAGDESRLAPAVHRYRDHGNLGILPGIFQAWQQLSQNNCIPVDVLIPIPVNNLRLKQLGFHAPLEFAKNLSRYLKIPVLPNLFKRLDDADSKNIPYTKNMRLNYLQHMIGMNLPACAKQLKSIQGAHVAVVGDIMTTGATFEVLARILKENGAYIVSNWFMLRTHQVEKI